FGRGKALVGSSAGLCGLQAVPAGPSGYPQHVHSPEIECGADEFPFVLNLVDASEAELAESEDVLDPAVGWLGNPFAFAICIASLLGLQLDGHRSRVRTPVRIELQLLLAFPSEGHDQFGV